jgi:hypothetical protein
MKTNKLFEMYKNFDLEEQIRFDMEYIKFKENEKLEKISKRLQIVENLNKIFNEDGSPYVSSEWIDKNILRNKNE